EERQVAIVVAQRRFEERGNEHFGEATLFPGRQESAQVEDAPAAWSAVMRAPDRVPLSVVRAVDVDGGLEITGTQRNALVLAQPGEVRHVAVVRAMEDQVADIAD